MDGKIIIYVVAIFTIIAQIGGVVAYIVKSTQAFKDYKEYNNTRYKEFRSDIDIRFSTFKDSFLELCKERSGNLDGRIERLEDIQNGT